MVDISIEQGLAVFTVRGLHKLLAFKSRIEIPLNHIEHVRADPGAARGWWKGLRAPGTHLPGVLAAGSFYKDGGWTFWDVRLPARAIVVELTAERYRRLIVEVEDPAAEVARFQPSSSP